MTIIHVPLSSYQSKMMLLLLVMLPPPVPPLLLLQQLVLMIRHVTAGRPRGRGHDRRQYSTSTRKVCVTILAYLLILSRWRDSLMCVPTLLFRPLYYPIILMEINEYLYLKYSKFVILCALKLVKISFPKFRLTLLKESSRFRGGGRRL